MGFIADFNDGYFFSQNREREKLRKKEKEREARKAMEATIKESDLQGKTEEEIDMMKVMGFSGFNTTKGKKVSFSTCEMLHEFIEEKTPPLYS